MLRRYFHKFKLKAYSVLWSDEQKIELVKMAGIVSRSKQSDHFKRGIATQGPKSITDTWARLYSASSDNINGLSLKHACMLVTRDCPMYLVAAQTRGFVGIKNVMMALWIDIELHMLDDIPTHLKDAVRAMAKFQRWLHGEDYRASLMKLIRGEL